MSSVGSPASDASTTVTTAQPCIISPTTHRLQSDVDVHNENITDAHRALTFRRYDTRIAEIAPDRRYMPLGADKEPAITDTCPLDSQKSQEMLHTPSEAVKAIKNGHTGFCLYAGRDDHGTENLVHVDHDDIEQFSLSTIPQDTLTVRTGSGGYHEVFVNDGTVANARSTAGEVRADNWYCVCPGAIHERGTVYHLCNDNEIATLSTDDLPDDLTPSGSSTSGSSSAVNGGFDLSGDEGQTSDSTPSLSDEEILNIATNANNGDRFERLFNNTGNKNPSRGDLALCGILAFYTQDASQIDRLFRKSRRMREKWDDVHSSNGQTYGAMTIETALSNQSVFYTQSTDSTNSNSNRDNDSDYTGEGNATAARCGFSSDDEKNGGDGKAFNPEQFTTQEINDEQSYRARYSGSLTTVADPDPLPDLYTSPPVGCYRQHDRVEPDIVLHNHGVDGDKTTFPPSIIGDGDAIEPDTIVYASDGNAQTQMMMERSGDGTKTIDRTEASSNSGVSTSHRPINDGENPTDADNRTNDNNYSSHPLTYEPMTVIDDDECDTANNPQRMNRLRMHHHEEYKKHWHGDKLLPFESRRIGDRHDWEDDQQNISDAVDLIFKLFYEQDIRFELTQWSQSAIERLYGELETDEGTLKVYTETDIIACLFALHCVDIAFDKPQSVQFEAYSTAVDVAHNVMEHWHWVKNTQTETEFCAGDIETVSKSIDEQLDCLQMPDHALTDLWTNLEL